MGSECGEILLGLAFHVRQGVPRISTANHSALPFAKRHAVGAESLQSGVTSKGTKPSRSLVLIIICEVPSNSTQ
jgi:hypothetical protein